MDEEMTARLLPRRRKAGVVVPAVEARLARDWDLARRRDLLIADRCPFCSVPHYYPASPDYPVSPGPAHGRHGEVVDAHCHLVRCIPRFAVPQIQSRGPGSRFDHGDTSSFSARVPAIGCNAGSRTMDPRMAGKRMRRRLFSLQAGPHGQFEHRQGIRRR